MLSIGDPAPPFSLSDDTGATVTLADLAGRRVVLYFYPKDDTPGCTTEACEFRDAFPRFKKSKAVILGISPDTPRKHANFKKKYDLPFTLLADKDHGVAERYGLWVEKLFWGRKYFGVERTTYVIGTDGKIKWIFSKVNPEGHAAEVEAALKSL